MYPSRILYKITKNEITSNDNVYLYSNIYIKHVIFTWSKYVFMYEVCNLYIKRGYESRSNKVFFSF